jgi:hypothetical protein
MIPVRKVPMGASAMQTTLTVIGIVILIAGLVFIGQGSGWFPYPASSFMVGARVWVTYGAIIAAAGAVIAIAARWLIN